MNRLPDEWLDEAELSLLASGYTPNADLQDCSEWSARQVAEIALTDDLIARIRAAERERMAYLARVVPGGGIRDWAAAEAVAATLVEVICQQEGALRNARWELGTVHDMLDAARAEVDHLKAHLATLKRLNDADTAEIDRLKETVALRAEVADLRETVTLLRKGVADRRVRMNDLRAKVVALPRTRESEPADWDEVAEVVLTLIEEAQHG